MISKNSITKGMYLGASGLDNGVVSWLQTEIHEDAGNAGKGFNTFNEAKKFLGSPGEGQQEGCR